ncbi:hypothetical protein [Streptomyces sp. NPDC090022]|uniref:hypothetical protein n=1 Tax=Streptomyces sp. NPDC090022 TaxID=3365920 RepID=UPI0037F36B5A
MNTVRRTVVRAVAVSACAAGVLALPAAAALADGAPAAVARGSVEPPRTLVKTLSLADGVSTAHVYRIAEGAYQADVLSRGAKVATLTSRAGAPGQAGSGTLRITLRPDGAVSSWVENGVAERDGATASGQPAGQDGHKTAVRTAGTPAAEVRTSDDVRSSDVRASEDRDTAATTEALRLNTLADGPGGGVLLLAAGGGMAAVGAAGLGFAMLRRGRTES